jgi:predicted ABC-type ATPase
VKSAIISPNLPFINADLHEQNSLQHLKDPQRRSEAARLWADSERARLLNEKVSFVSETVFSHESKLLLIEQALEAGFLVVLYVVALDDPQVLIARVQQRVKEGGHHVPSDRILARYPRTLENLKRAIQIASASYIYDSSSNGDHGDPALALVAVVRPSNRVNPLIRVAQKSPDWVEQLLDS